MKQRASPSPFPTSVPAEFADQWVAVYRRQLVDHDADPDRLFARLDQQGLGEKALVFHVPRPGVIWV